MQQDTENKSDLIGENIGRLFYYFKANEVFWTEVQIELFCLF